MTVTSGANTASFYYKDTASGTPTITADESPSAGWTAGTQQETITSLSISNSPGTYSFGVVTVSSTPASGLTYFTVTNDGSVTVNITISGTDMTGGTAWTLSDTATSGADTVGLAVGLEGGSYNIIVKKNATFNTLVSSLGAGNSQRWGLKLYAPTSFSDESMKTGTITLTATQA